MMKFIALVLWGVAYTLGYHLQWYVMPRWDLEALQLGEYVVFCAVSFVIALLAKLGAMLFEHGD